MTHRYPTATLALVVMIACLGCGKTPPPVAPPKLPDAPPVTIAAPVDAVVKATMTITAGADTNPDATGRPSPVVVRIYQLKADGAFKSADFLALFDDEQKALGPELITRDEYVMAPSGSRTLDIVLSGETRFVGALAAFRDYRSAAWRAVTPAPKQGLTVMLARTSVVLTARD